MSFKWWRTISFPFEIGNREKHQMTLFINRFFNHVKIKMGKKTIKRHIFLFETGSDERQIDFKVGDMEKHDVAVHFQMPNYFLPQLHPWIFTIYDNGKIVKKVEA